MNSILHPAPISLISTARLARLDVPWDGVRAELGADHIGDLWRSVHRSPGVS